MAIADQPPAIECTVQQDEAGGRLRLRGRLVSSRDTQGTYDLHIVKTGTAGSANLKMGGAFVAAANVETFVGLANFNIEPGARYVTELTLRVGDESYACRKSGGETK